MFECYRTKKLIKRIVVGEDLSASDEQRLQSHLAVCSQCKQRFEREQELDRFIQQGFNAFQSERDITAEILAQIDSGPVPPAGEKIKLAPLRFRPVRLVWVSALSIVGIILSIYLNQFYSQYTQQIRVQDIRGGGVAYREPGMARSLPIKPGMKLIPGTKLSTNKWCQAELRSPSGLRVWVNKETILLVAMNTAYTIEIKQGEIYIEKSASTKMIRIKTPAGTIEPIGTKFDIQIAENGATQVAVVQGKVNFINLAGQIAIAAGYYSSAEVTQNILPSTPKLIDTRKLIEWIYVFNQVTVYSIKQRETLANQAIERGKVFFKENRMYSAATSFLWATELTPESPRAYYNLGLAYGYLGQFAQKADACLKVLELDPNYADIHYQLGRTYFQLYKFENAISEWNIVVHQDPQDHKYTIWLGLAYIRQGNLAEGERIIKLGLTLTPCDNCMSIAYYGLGLSAYKQGKIDLALDYAEKSVQRNPNDTLGYWLLSKIYYKLGDTKQGLYYQHQAEKMDIDFYQTVKKY